jgi:rod shape-determining protein MreC
MARRHQRLYRPGNRTSLIWPVAVAAIVIIIWLISLVAGRQQSVGGVVTAGTGKGAKAADAVRGEIIGFGEVFRFRSHVRHERQLEAENGLLKAELQQAATIKRENEQLRQLLKLNIPAGFTAIGAEAVTRSMDLWFDTIVLDRGSEAGITRQCLVINSDGLVGEIAEVGSGYAKVRLLTSPDFALSGFTNTSNIGGIVKGRGLIKLAMEYVPVDAPLKLQEKVYTAALAVQEDGKPRPRGILIGFIDSIKKNPDQSTLQVVVRPAVNVSNIGPVAVLIPQ